MERYKRRATRKVERSSIPARQRQCLNSGVADIQRTIRRNYDISRNCSIFDITDRRRRTSCNCHCALGILAYKRDGGTIFEGQGLARDNYDTSRDIPGHILGDGQIAIDNEVCREVGIIDCPIEIIAIAEDEALLAAREIIRGGIGDRHRACEVRSILEHILYPVSIAIQLQFASAGELPEEVAGVLTCSDVGCKTIIFKTVVEFNSCILTNYELCLADIFRCILQSSVATEAWRLNLGGRAAVKFKLCAIRLCCLRRNESAILENQSACPSLIRPCRPRRLNTSRILDRYIALHRAGD